MTKKSSSKSKGAGGSKSVKTVKAAKPGKTVKKGKISPNQAVSVVPVHTLDERKLLKAAKGPYGKYVKLLLDLRDRLLDGIEFHASDNLRRTQREASSDLSAYSFHMADAGTDNFDREFALSMVSNEQELLYEINEALKRLENDSFGLCEMSGKPIPRARLDAIPWARYTVQCQEDIEKTQARKQPQTFTTTDFGNSEDASDESDSEL